MCNDLYCNIWLQTLSFSYRHLLINKLFVNNLKGNERFGTLEVQFGELRAWLTTKIHWFEQSHLARGQAALDYSEYQKFCSEFNQKKEIYDKMNHVTIFDIIPIYVNSSQELLQNMFIWRTRED